MRKGLYIFTNFLMAIFLFVMGVAAAAAITIVLFVIGIYLIFTGLKAFTDPYIYDEDGYAKDRLSFGSQLFACALFAVPGIFIIRLTDSAVEGGTFLGLFMGVFFIVFGYLRFRKCRNEACSFYVEGFAKVCSYLYPIAILVAGVLFSISPFNSGMLLELASVLLVVASVLWMIRTVLVVKQN